MKNRELQRVVRAQALHLQEQAARTEADFWKLADSYDLLDRNRERKERYYEKLSTEKFIEWQLRSGETVIPRPINHVWWRELLNGNPIDVIFDCPYEISELVSSQSIYELLKELDENRKEILYYSAIRQWSPQKIAVHRGQTDRNIRKVYNTTINNIRKKLYERLSPRYEKGLSLTLRQREFCENYKSVLEIGNEGKLDETE